MKIRYLDVAQDKVRQERYVNLKDILVVSLKLKNGDIDLAYFCKELEDLIG